MKFKFFDINCLYNEWDNELDGKEVFLCDSIDELINVVEKPNGKFKSIVHKNLEKSNNTNPFCNDYRIFKYCYFDPRYEYLVAYDQGKTIQWFNTNKGEWQDLNYIPELLNVELRLKPNRYVHKGKTGYYYDDCIDGSVFSGTTDECEQYIKDNR